EQLEPNLLLLDLTMPKLNGLEVVRQLKKKHPATRILILTMHEEESCMSEAMRNGADGYLIKSTSGTELIKVVRKILSGRRHFNIPLSTGGGACVDRKFEPGFELYETLSNRERTVLQLTAEGRTSTEIAASLYISPRTVETHRSNLMQKLGIHSQTELVRF